MRKQKDDRYGLILDAARQCYLERGIAGTGMGQVAKAAGIARSTLYRYFPTRNDVLVAVIRREMEAANEVISKHLDAYDSPADMIVEGLLMAVEEIPRRPLLQAVFASDEDAPARRVIWQSDVIVAFGEELMASTVQPALETGLMRDDVRPEVMVEWVYRILLSFLTLPSNWVCDPEEMRSTLRALLIPVLLR